MIYRNSYFKKESRQTYVDNTVSLQRKIVLALFTGLISFALYFVLQTLKESVLADAAPEIMQPSFFSTIYIYIHAAMLSITTYFIVYYDSLFFSEIRRNAWYLLIQMRYRPIVMIADKIAALLYSMFIIYTAGFAFTTLLTVFLKFSFVFAYIPALYIAGLADIFLLTVFCLIISLFVHRTDNARLLIFAAAVFVYILKATTGAYIVLRNRVAMQDLGNLFDTVRSWYFPAAAAIFAVCVTGAVTRARRLAQYYSLSGIDKVALPSGVIVTQLDNDTDRQKKKKSVNYERRRRLLNATVTTLLIVFIAAATRVQHAAYSDQHGHTRKRSHDPGHHPLCVSVGYDAAGHQG